MAIDNENTTNAHVEGKDSVGKGTAVRAVLAAVLFAKEIIINGIAYEPKDVLVLQTDFPQYWGFGALIRKMNSKVGREYFKENALNQEEELHIRKAMYAIDRLIGVAILNKKISETNAKKIIHISDRGPFAQVITHAVCYEGNKDGFLASLSEVRDADQGYINAVNPNTILLDADESGLTGAGKREVLDDLENEKYQALAEHGFELLKRETQLKIHSVVTRVGKIWRNKVEIADEILRTMNVEVVRDEKTNAENLKIADFSKRKNLVQIGASQFIQTFYPNEAKQYGEIGRATHFTSVFDWDLKRKGIYFANSEQMKEYLEASKESDSKKMLITHEEMISTIIGQLLRDHPVGEYAKTFLSEDARKAGEYLLNEYTGRMLLDFVSKLERVPGSYSRFLRDLFIEEQKVW